MTQYVVDWNGTTLPPELRNLPPGRYVMEPLLDDYELTDAEEEGILEALAELETGGGLPWDEALRQIRAEKAR